jgi:hypothetical protein
MKRDSGKGNVLFNPTPRVPSCDPTRVRIPVREEVAAIRQATLFPVARSMGREGTPPFRMRSSRSPIWMRVRVWIFVLRTHVEREGTRE